MRTQIIQLDQNDDTLSVRDKMSWSQTGQILLVWPVHGRLLYRQLDLKLVNRYAASMGAHLGLVTHDAEVLFYAHQMGIPVFRNLSHTEVRSWKVNRSARMDLRRNSQQHNLEKIRKMLRPTTPTWVEHPFVRFLCLGISVLTLFILGISIIPSAKIILSPRVQTQSIRFDLSADPSLTSINLSTGYLPTYTKDVIVEGREMITATGSMIIPDDPAICNLKFTNRSKQTINISARTIVATLAADPVRFITTSTGDVTIYPFKSVVVPARAIKPGSSGNLPPNKLVIIEGNLGQDLTVTNPDATQGGTDATVPSPTIQDLQTLRERLHTNIKETALFELHSMLPDDDTLISPTLSIIETVEETSIPPIGEPGTQLELSMRLRFQSQVVSGEAVRNLVTPVLNSNTPVGYSPILNSLEITQLNQPSLGQDGIAHWTITAIRKLQVVIQTYQVIDLVKGATFEKAKEYLFSSLPLNEPAQIILAPKWWPRLPFLSMRILVTQAEIP